MARFVAFLRGMNLGNRRITNAELCHHFETLGFEEVSAFLASGNVLFRATPEDGFESAISEGLSAALDYPVPTFVRSADEVSEIARCPMFSAEASHTKGNVQVGLLKDIPSQGAARGVVAMATDRDLLAVQGRELYMLPVDGVSSSELDFREIERQLGPMTVRTHRTYQRLDSKLQALGQE